MWQQRAWVHRDVDKIAAKQWERRLSRRSRPSVWGCELRYKLHGDRRRGILQRVVARDREPDADAERLSGRRIQQPVARIWTGGGVPEGGNSVYRTSNTGTVQDFAIGGNTVVIAIRHTGLDD